MDDNPELKRALLIIKLPVKLLAFVLGLVTMITMISQNLPDNRKKAKLASTKSTLAAFVNDADVTVEYKNNKFLVQIASRQYKELDAAHQGVLRMNLRMSDTKNTIVYYINGILCVADYYPAFLPGSAGGPAEIAPTPPG